MERKEIIGILKDEGIDVGEDLALAAVKSAITLLKRVVPQVSRGFGGALVFFLGVYEEEIYKLVDAIDGKVDSDYK